MVKRGKAPRAATLFLISAKIVVYTMSPGMSRIVAAVDAALHLSPSFGIVAIFVASIVAG